MEDVTSNWLYSPEHGQFCQIVVALTLGDGIIYRFWPLGKDSVLRPSAAHFRLEAVPAGLKEAWQEWDYATIIPVANKIPENVLQEDPKLLMWFDQALTRTGGHS
ncbi:MAG: hypothetical protein AB1512_07120 [Thermodesulfobacteriota bacterium]